MNLPLRYAVLVCVLVTSPLLVWLTVYRPTNQAIEDVAVEIRNRTKRLTKISEINEQYRHMQRATDALDNATEVAFTRLPSRHQAEQWLGEASLAAESSGLVVRNVAISGNRESGVYNLLPVNLEVTGSFAGVFDLIQRFERMNLFIPIHNLDIQHVNDTTVDATIVLHLVHYEGVSQ